MLVLKRLLIALVLLVALALLAVLLLPSVVPGLHSSSLTMILNVFTGRGAAQPSDTLLARLEAAPGYNVSVFARDLPHPRMMALAAPHQLLVSNPRPGTVTLLEDSDGDGAADSRRDLLSGLRNPHGLALHQGFLYVAESNRVGRVALRDGALAGEYEVLISGLTDNGNHWTKSIAIGPDDKLYLAMGSSCNVCEEADPRRATVMRFNADGSDGRIFASGLRNSVGLAFAPWNGALFATDNGRDLLGDNYPPCELNRVEEDGFYGWPYRNGANEPDPDFGGKRPALEAQAIAPVHSFRAHNAPLGITFLPGVRSALVALHGSWNRSTPDGYKVVRLDWSSAGISEQDFLWGFESDGDIIGRPVDVVDDGKGGVFVSDDYAKVVYRVSPQTGLASAANADTAAVAGSPLDADSIAAGAALYETMPCDECHKAPANPRLRLENLAERYTPTSLAAYFLTPTPPMPRYELDAEQRAHLAHYLLHSRGQARASHLQ
ncbi:MAG: PQQ-dependent sugar dehydrogenase [Halieaceae bacterium]|nr:PQQ-dependent sugar dehydrogenase [Halieaceae bacterium]